MSRHSLCGPLGCDSQLPHFKDQQCSQRFTKVPEAEACTDLALCQDEVGRISRSVSAMLYYDHTMCSLFGI